MPTQREEQLSGLSDVAPIARAVMAFLIFLRFGINGLGSREKSPLDDAFDKADCFLERLRGDLNANM